MTQDKALKIAIRQRMAATGEPYSVARHAVLEGLDEALGDNRPAATERLRPPRPERPEPPQSPEPPERSQAPQPPEPPQAPERPGSTAGEVGGPQAARDAAASAGHAQEAADRLRRAADQAQDDADREQEAADRAEAAANAAEEHAWRVQEAARHGFKGCVLPHANKSKIRVPDGFKIYGASHIGEMLGVLV